MGFDALDAATATALACDVNDELADAVRAYPTRFAGFAALGLKDPAAAAAELERCVTHLGFKGALVDGTTGGLFLDAPRFLPVFEAAAHLGVPIYLHPAPPPEPVREAYFSGLPGELGFLLSIAGWGWHAETGLHTLRLIVSGLFDRLPGLQLIIGHMGEGLPYALARSSGVLSHAAPHLGQPVAAYFQSNIHLTTSGYFTAPPLRCALEVVGIDRLQFSIDYPYSPNTRGGHSSTSCRGFSATRRWHGSRRAMRKRCSDWIPRFDDGASLCFACRKNQRLRKYRTVLAQSRGNGEEEGDAFLDVEGS